MRTLVALALMIFAAPSLNGQQPPAHASQQSAVVPVNAVRNPPYLRANEILGRRMPGAQPRVRFEWEHVPGATSYVLGGQWTNNQSWAVRSFEYRVTDRNATSWRANHVTFDVMLAHGSHSWKLVAIFGKGDAGDFENPAQVSFDIRDH